jgi:uroporphyrinogen decarboxylase
MTSKERVHRALRRDPVDRVPVWMWFHPYAAQRLAAALEIPPAALAEALGDDVRQTWVANNHAMEGIVHEHDGERHLDDWGVEWTKEGPFNQILHSPLADADAATVRRYRYPSERIEALLGNLEPVMREAARCFIGCDVSPCLVEMVCRLRGMEQTLFDLAGDPDLARAQLEAAAAFAVALSTAACDRFAVDWLWLGDDMGSQRGMIMSPAMWREQVRPHLAAIAAVGQTRGLWVAYHSCGAIRPIIPDLIEIGINVLNPIQCNCPGMAAAELKRDFGDTLAFHGGVDTQDLLPNGTAARVHRETSRLIETMTTAGGGYILGASHAVPPETPVANLLAMYAAAGISREEIGDRAAAIRARERVRERVPRPERAPPATQAAVADGKRS